MGFNLAFKGLILEWDTFRPGQIQPLLKKMLDSNLVNVSSNGSSYKRGHNAQQTPMQILFETYVNKVEIKVVLCAPWWHMGEWRYMYPYS
jgi:hypothetical protein